ncbi:hypothetical protein HELRODRAFT_177110 [Helobdella robusta]|uniref:C-type lectin domain-containing protein n=1 Tax=Helobdella robusta TaxID=6412 RepID=T1FB86_HELRO|nr:hypothetical protein HELRODRAFT_177110 [Helobdella robusta]ESN98231.1 hypothetical protein HELRODRAFT_177110 [Helobdella robusta]
MSLISYLISIILLRIGSPCGEPGSQWLNFGQSCYRFSTALASTFEEALNICISMDSLLVSIGSYGENNFIVQKGSGLSTNYWIGMYRIKCLIDEGQHSYWLDGTDFKFSNWLVDEPDENTCCSRIIAQGVWRDKPCNNGYLYICEKPLEIKLPTEKRAIKRLTDKYIVGDSLREVHVKRCSPMHCLSLCMQNWICGGFNMIPELSGGCSCHLKDARSWLTFNTVSKAGAGYWSYPIYGYD